MATPPLCDFGWQAPDFTLPATDGKTYSLADISGQNGSLIMFICNHCPYVLAILDRMIRDAADLQAIGIGVAAICSNDATTHPADSFDNMKLMADTQGFTFPYLHDQTQSVARSYDAVCTPDFFGFDKSGGLQYRGRLDASARHAADTNTKRELFDAMQAVAQSGKGPQIQTPSMGCSIKWRAA